MKGNKNPFFNKLHSTETKSKMVKSNKNRNPNTYIPGVISPETRKIMYKDRWKNMSEESREKMVGNFIIAGQKSSKKSYETSIENSVFSMINNYNLSIKKNFQIGIFNVDFLINDKYIIECFGDYWHCNPNLYSENFYNKSIKLTSKEKWDKDLNRKIKLENKGYQFISFWEEDIVNNTDKICADILLFLKIKKALKT
jgi:very-short-patch-repair endonuclease